MKAFFDSIKQYFLDNIAVSILDVIFFALILYLIFIFIKKKNIKRIIKYIVVFLFLTIIFSSDDSYLGFLLIPKFFQYGIIFVVVAALILFPQEVRRSLWKISSPKEDQETYTNKYDCSDEELNVAIGDIVKACQNMAKKNVGALIIVAPYVTPNHILDSGTRLDAKLSTPLLESIFNTKAPLHDGAVFVKGDRIMAAGCFLPLSQNQWIDKELGTRHRAAIGVTEQYNVLAIIVSEETGVISTAQDGIINRYYDSAMLTGTLEDAFGLGRTTDKSKKKKAKKIKKETRSKFKKG